MSHPDNDNTEYWEEEPTDNWRRRDDADYDANAPSDDDGRSGKATIFHPSEANDPDKFRRLWKRHTSRESQQTAREAQRRRDAATWCNALEFTDYQRDRVVYLIDRVSFDNPLTGYALGSTEGILAIILHVAAEEGRELIEVLAVTGDGADVEVTDEQFAEILDHAGTPANDIMKTRQLLREEIDDVE